MNTDRIRSYGLGEDVKRIAVEGGSLHVEEQGSGPVLLLLHGWSLDARMWTKQFQRLSNIYRVVAPDRRGFGRSTAPPGLGYEIQDILDLMDQLGINRCLLWGMSQGGRIAQRFAAEHPDLLTGLILQSAPMDGTSPATGREAIPIQKFKACAQAGDLETLRRQWLKHPIMRCDDELVQSLLDSMVGSYDARDLNLPGDAGKDCVGLGNIDVPVSYTHLTLPTTPYV